jgi:hypothetical protein
MRQLSDKLNWFKKDPTLKGLFNEEPAMYFDSTESASNGASAYSAAGGDAESYFP